MKRSKILATALGLSLTVASIGVVSNASAIYDPDTQMSTTNALPMEAADIYLQRTVTKAGNSKDITNDGHFTYDFRLVRTASGGTTDPCVTTPGNCVGGISTPGGTGSQPTDNILDHAHINFGGTQTYNASNKTSVGTAVLGLGYLEFYREDVYYFEITENAIDTDISGKYARDTTNKYTVVIAAPQQEVDGDGETITGGVPYAYVVEILDASGNNKIDGDDLDPLAFTADRIVPNTSIELTKTAKGAFARTDINFEFSVNVSGGTGNYTVTLPASTVNCTYGTACTINLKHGETAYIGKSGSTEQFDPSASLTYTISEVAVDGYTTTAKINGTSASLTDTTVSNRTLKTTASQNVLEAENGVNMNEVEFINKKDLLPSPTGVFFNIVPFIGLGIAATIGIVALKKTKQEA